VYRSSSLIRPSLAFAAIAALALSLAYFAAPALVRADSGTIPWEGQGSDQLPCDGGAHWVLAPADGIESATLHVGDSTYVMTQNGQGSWAADSDGAVPSDQSEVWVEFTSSGDTSKDHLQLSHCLTGETGQEGASLLIRKTSSVFVDGKAEHLAGAVFSVEIEGNVIGTFTTDSDGAICITGLPFTVQATVTEITPPPGYDLPAVTTQVVWVDDNDICNSAEAIFRDPPTQEQQTFPVSLTKVDQNDDPIEGVAFTLTGVTDDTFTASVSTDADGKLTFDSLAAGDYELTETAPEDCTGIAAIALNLDDSGAVSFTGAHDGASLDSDGNIVVENTCQEGGQQGGGSSNSPKGEKSPEGGVQAATGSPAASTPNTAFAAQDSTSSASVLGILALIVALGLLAFANVRTSRRRS
jgi:Prealbumin-like fold domain